MMMLVLCLFLIMVMMTIILMFFCMLCLLGAASHLVHGLYPQLYKLIIYIYMHILTIIHIYHHYIVITILFMNMEFPHYK